MGALLNSTHSGQNNYAPTVLSGVKDPVALIIRITTKTYYSCDGAPTDRREALCNENAKLFKTMSHRSVPNVIIYTR